MRSTITSRGQTVIPAPIRRRFNLTPADRLEWIVENNTIRVIPVHADPIAAFRGQGRGGAVERLLAERQEDKARE
ncbi:MAG: AbrB/MazE/SpoVT family DNA-binding domain-containing protein [Anaerolineales bacterium]|nr:AbrB/MazE/SpoVT family DNA-binding domain-containing protein [Anaerolineales bacterium]